FAQSDTLRLTIPEAENIFLQHNLSLIAAQYDVDATTALIRQAKLWDNPVLLTDQNLYDGKFFSHTKDPSRNTGGQIYLQVQELIRTAGKIRKLSDLARANAAISSLQFDQVMHNLRYTLHTDLYQSAELISVIELDEQENSHLAKLLTAMKAQLDAGNISQKDFLRVEALQV